MKHYSKTYRATSYDHLHIVFEVNGNLEHVYFGGVNRYRMIRGLYVTSNEAIQNALENYPTFGRDFILEKKELISDDGIEEKAPVVEEKAEDAAPQFVTMTFKTVKECQDFLQKEHGKKGYLYSSYAKCKTVCRELGIDAVFENENN